MKEFDYIIVGGGCAGLSLAYELEINDFDFARCRILCPSSAQTRWFPHALSPGRIVAG